MLEDCSQYMTNLVAVEVPASVQEDENMDISPIEPNAYALSLARAYCRTQMDKIVLEVLHLLVMATGVIAYIRTGIQVDAVANDPGIASAPGKLTPSKVSMSFGPGSQSQNLGRRCVRGLGKLSHNLGQQLIQRLVKPPHIRPSRRFG